VQEVHTTIRRGNIFGRLNRKFEENIKTDLKEKNAGLDSSGSKE
jgi:hypothetical protein